MVTQMNDEIELKEALDFISPASLTYEEWTMVGMGLKEAGLPVTVWEAWSARDGGRYHKGECARKWESFHGSTKPVTESSIFQLAYSHGWSGPAGHALDWGDELTTGSSRTEGQLVDPRWVESHDLALPEQWDPVDQLRRYLQALFEQDEHVAYVTESFMADDRRRPTRGCWDRTAGQLIAELDTCGGDIGKVVGDCDPEVGAWICFNPVDGTGRKDANITAYRYALVECDNMDLGRQQAIIKQLELPCAALVYSGGKSVHAIVKVDAPDYTEYRKRVDYLYAACQKNGLTLDQQNRNPSRLSRMPGILRGSQRQTLLETNGYQALVANTCAMGQTLFTSHNPDLIILDLGLPDRDGLELIRFVRQKFLTPIVVLSARTTEQDKIEALDLGANDYITKPFGTGELLARVRAALRTNRFGVLGGMPGGVFRAQGLEINYERRKVFVDGAEIKLTQTEYNIVAFLSQYAGRVMTYAAIVKAIWGDTDCGSTKKLQVNMANIRKKLGSVPGRNTYILNELGVGYRMIDEDTDARPES